MAAMPSSALRPGVAAEGRGECILLVEDHADTAAALAELLRVLGHEVAVASNGRAALDCGVAHSGCSVK